MEKSTKYFLLALTLIVVIVVGYRYYQYVINRNFTLLVNTVCDPATETCFVMDCVEGEEDCDTTPYKKIEINDSEAPKCLEEHICESFTCDQKSMPSCSVTYCAEDSIEDGEKCTGTAAETETEIETTTTSTEE